MIGHQTPMASHKLCDESTLRLILRLIEEEGHIHIVLSCMRRYAPLGVVREKMTHLFEHKPLQDSRSLYRIRSIP